MTTTLTQQQLEGAKKGVWDRRLQKVSGASSGWIAWACVRRCCTDPVSASCRNTHAPKTRGPATPAADC